MTRLSVVVPIYNVEKYLNKCLESIVNQLHKEDELILVDDGSKDRCGEMADAFAALHENVSVIHQPNQGLSAARNTGIDAAKGEWIAFVDSDDYIEPDMYCELLEYAQKNHAQMAKGGVWYEKENGEKRTPYPDNIAKCWDTKEALVELNSYRYCNMSFCDGVFQRQLFEEDGSGRGALRFPVGKLSEDYYLMHRVIARATQIAYTSKPYYHYVQRGNSISRNKRINMAPMDASVKQLEFFEENFPDIAYAAETVCAFSHMGIYSAHLRQDVPCPDTLLAKLRVVSRRYLKSVMRNQQIPSIKKFQAFTFCYMLPVYRFVIKRTQHR